MKRLLDYGFSLLRARTLLSSIMDAELYPGQMIIIDDSGEAFLLDEMSKYEINSRLSESGTSLWIYRV